MANQPPNLPQQESCARWRYFYPYLPGLALLVCAVLVILANVAAFGIRLPPSVNDLKAFDDLWIDNTPGTDPGKARAVLDLRDAAARLNWMAMGLLQTIAFLFALCYFSAAIMESGGSLWTLAMLLGIVAAIGGGLVLFEWIWFPLDYAFGTGLPLGGQLHALLFKKFAVPHLKWVVALHNVLAVAVFVFGAAAAGFMLLPQQSEPPFSDASLRARLTRLRRLLTVSAVVLVIGVMQISAEFRWPAALLQEKAGAAGSNGEGVLAVVEAVEAYASSMSLTAGVCFSLGILFVFGTSFLVLDREARILATARPESWLSEEAWRKKRGLSLAWDELYGDMSKIIGPLMAGVIGGFISF